MNLRLCLIGLLVLTCGPFTMAGDWPCWRGPGHDGISNETGLRSEWNVPIPMRWDREVGSAFSSFAVVGERVFTGGSADRQQLLICLSAETGAVLWQRPFEKQYNDPQGGDGPRATPTVADGLVYMLGGHGRLICVKAENGDLVWEKSFGDPPQWGYSGSVLIEGDLAIVSPGGSAGGLAAFDRRTGEPAWKSGSDDAGYATPYPFTFEGTRYLAGFLGSSAMIAEAASGREVWNMPWKTSYKVNAAAPIFHDGLLLFSSGYRHGCIVVRLSAGAGQLKSETLWESGALRNKFQSGVLHEGHVYSSDEQGLKCVEFASGQTRWEEPRMKHGTLVLAEGHLYILTEQGELIIAPATTAGFQPKTRAELLTGRCWTAPVIANGNLYVRNLSRVASFRLREP